MLEEDVIKPAVSKWTSPVVLAPMRPEKLRFCVDYRKLKAMNVPDTYRSSQTDDCIDLLRDANTISAIDCSSRYLQIEISEAGRSKTAFTATMALFDLSRCSLD